MKKDNLYNLPRKYLSHSQMELWHKDKVAYRNRYYLGGPSFENPETILGKRVANLLEHWKTNKKLGHEKLGISKEFFDVLNRVPLYQYCEYRIELSVGGVPFLGVIDSFSKRRKRILEMKTGKQEWNDIRVRKHNQLTIYSLLTKLKFGKVDPWLRLVWMETRYKKSMDTIGSITCEAESNELELTGKIQIFKRKIYEWERQNMVKLIQKTAQEISDDYTNFLKTKK